MKIVLINDPVLRKPTDLVLRDELDYIKSLVPEMASLMEAEAGVGLAANQVGVSKRFFILKSERGLKLYINPEITSIGELLPFNEGCLSIPGVNANTLRANQLKLKYLDDNFNELEEEYKDFNAAAIQHEIDHLDGILYIDQLGETRRSILMDRHRKYLKLLRRS